MSMLLGVLAITVAWVAGWVVVRVLAGREAVAWGLGPAIGMGGASLIGYPLVRLGRAPGLMVAGALALGGLALLLRGHTPCGEGKRGGASGWEFWVSIGAAVVLAVFWVAIVSEAPYGQGDAIGIWNLRARFLASADPRAFAPELEASHLDYPLLVPLAVAYGWACAGAVSPLVPILAAAGFTASLLITAVRFARPRWRPLVAVALAGCATLAGQAATENADVPLAAFALGALVYAVGAQRRGEFVLGGLCAGFAAWTKNEGLVVLLLSAVLVSLRRTGTERRGFGWGLALPLLALGHFKFFVAPRNDLVAGAGDLYARLTDLQRLAEVAEGLGRAWLDLGSGSIVWVCAAALLARVRPSGRLLGAAASWFAVDAAVYWLLSPEPHWQMATSAQRLLVQLYPIVVLALLGEPVATRRTTPTTTPRISTSRQTIGG